LRYPGFMKSIRVLIVDDLPQVRQGLASLLHLAAKRVIPVIEVIGEAQNGYEAIQQAQALHPDVILMDLEMPIMDGYEATRQIKANRLAPRVIILSIHADLEDQQRAWEAGADDFIAKDTGYEILLNAILAKPASFPSTNPPIKKITNKMRGMKRKNIC
jgi:DNA-binding NarL/FixJ family response regulator